MRPSFQRLSFDPFSPSIAPTACRSGFKIKIRPVMYGLLLALLWGVMSLMPNMARAAGTNTNAQSAMSAQDYQTLVKILKNPTSRAALIKTLQQLAARSNQKVSKPTSPIAASTGTVGHVTLSASFLTTINALLGRSQQALMSSETLVQMLVYSPRVAEHWLAIGNVAWRIATIALVAYLILGLIWLLTGRVRAALFETATQSHSIFRLLLALLATAAVSALGIALAWIAGGALAAGLSEGAPRLGVLLSQFLEAFLWVEIVRQGARLLLGKTHSMSAVLLGDQGVSQQVLSGLSRLTLWLGYGLLWLSPLLQSIGKPALSMALVWLVAIIAFFMALRWLFSLRTPITRELLAAADRNGDSVAGWGFQVLARSWWILSIGYLLLTLGALLLRPQDVLPFIGHATVVSLLAVLISLLVLKGLHRWLGSAVSLHAGIKQMLPALEMRVNQVLPYIMKTLRVLVLIIAAAVIINAWHVANVLGWFASPTGQLVLSRIVGALAILGVALAIWVVLDSMIEARLQGEGDKTPSARLQTLLGLLRIVIAIVLATLAIMMALSQLGMNIGPLLAGTSVLGLAVGFGSQKLVQDVINGVFIQLENAINVGDIISVGGITGTAEMVSIRSVRIRDLSGTYHIVPYSAVNEVSNYSHQFANYVGVYGIAYREDIDEAIGKLKEAFDELMQDPDMKNLVLEPMTVHGVVALNSSSVDIRISIKTAPGNQWAVGRAYTRLVKIHFDRAGIEIPFPQQTVWFGVDKAGDTAELPIRISGEQPDPSGQKS